MRRTADRSLRPDMGFESVRARLDADLSVVRCVGPLPGREWRLLLHPLAWHRKPGVSLGRVDRLRFGFEQRAGRASTLIHPDGSGLVGLVCGDPSISDPAISPDGTTIAFTAAVGDGTSQVILQAGSLKTLTAMSGGADQPTFSPDGKSIAFHSVGKTST